MSDRNLSPMEMFRRMADAHRPKFTFDDATTQDFASWKAEALPAVLATLGQSPERVPPNAELMVEWLDDGLRKQRWWIDVGPYISAIFQVNIPADLAPGETRPAILCWHGHGAYGKEPVMGNIDNPDVAANAKAHNYVYGQTMAKAGFVTYAIDWMPGGDRHDARKPNFRSQGGNRDWCNLLYLHATMFGSTLLAMNLTQGMLATDFACSLPEVDAAKIGVMGLSGGGTMTTWTSLVDPRIAATEIMCYSDRFEEFGIRDLNYCGMQVTPGLYALVDLPELQGLIAPRPLLVDIGVQDSCFRVESAMKCYKKVERIFAAAGVPENLELDLFNGEHAWGGNKSVDFFRRHLGG